MNQRNLPPQDGTASELTTQNQVQEGTRRGDPDAGPVLGTPQNVERDAGNTDLLTAAARSAGAAAQGGDLPNTVANPRQGAAPAWTAGDVRGADFARIQSGWSVVSADGEQIGEVTEIGPDWLAVPYGVDRERTMYLPLQYIETVANRRVILNQPAGLLIDMKLDAPPQRFPEEHQRLSGTEMEALRGEPGSPPIVEAADVPAQAEAPPSAGRSTGQMSSEGWTPPDSKDVKTAAGGIAPPLPGTGHTAAMRIDAGERLRELRSAELDPALQPAEPRRDQSAPHSGSVEATVNGMDVAEHGAPEGATRMHTEISTRMDAPVTGEHSTAWQRVNAQDTLGQSFEERSGFTVLSSDVSYDREDGPTHQPGVRPDNEHRPLRTQFGTVGTPGEGKERNVTDLDLTRNRHPGSGPFDSQASTVGRPLAPGEPSVAQRSIPGAAGTPLPPPARPHDVPRGAVSRPAPNAEQPWGPPKP